MKFKVKEIQNWSVGQSSDGKTWSPARPMNRGEPLVWRIKNALGVLTGKYDALDWR